MQNTVRLFSFLGISTLYFGKIEYYGKWNGLRISRFPNSQSQYIHIIYICILLQIPAVNREEPYIKLETIVSRVYFILNYFIYNRCGLNSYTLCCRSHRSYPFIRWHLAFSSYSVCGIPSIPLMRPNAQ